MLIRALNLDHVANLKTDATGIESISLSSDSVQLVLQDALEQSASCFGTFGSFGTEGGCFGSFGTFGVVNKPFNNLIRGDASPLFLFNFNK